MNEPPLRLGPAAAGRCRRRVHLDHAPDAPRAARSRPDAGVQMRLDDMQEHTQKVLDGLPAAATGWSPQSDDRPAIVRAPLLRTGTRIGTPELLIAADGGYLPVIVRGHRTLDPGGEVELSTLTDPFTVFTDRTRRRRKHPMDVLQLAHHYAMLVELGVAAATPRGGVIGRGGPAPVGVVDTGGSVASLDGGATDDDSAVILWHDLSLVAREYAARFADRQAVAAAAASGGELARPSRVSECRRCSWWPICSAELEAAHDISLLTAGADVPLLHEAGLFTLDDLVAAPPRSITVLPLTSIPPTEARVRAKARLDGLPVIRRTESAAAPRAAVEMDIDMESYLDDGAYLWGTLLSGTDIGFEQGYRPFASFDGVLPGDGEAAAFVEFWTYLSSVRNACAERDLTFAAYCWSRTAEERWLYSTPRRYPHAPGMPTDAEVAAFCRSAQWIDLYAVVKTRFVVTGSLRLKAIAPIAGFHWRDAEPGGENSMAWYRAAVGADDPAGRPDPLMRQRVLDYNEDDVRATAAIRDWLSEGARLLPTVAQLLAEIDRVPARG